MSMDPHHQDPRDAVQHYLQSLLSPGVHESKPTEEAGHFEASAHARWSNVRLLQAQGLRCLVPASCVEEVIEQPEGLSGRFPAPFVGLLSHGRGRALCLWLESVLRPEMPPPEAGANHAVLFGQGRWALYCEQVGEPMELRSERVRWRPEGGRRPWLVGAALSLRSALVDADILERWLLQRLKAR